MFNRVLLAGLALVCLIPNNVAAKAVFAHFMVGNADGWNQGQWETEIDLAMQAKIDAFALNIAHGDAPNSVQLGNAFGAANKKGFKLFISFDYAGGDGAKTGGWPKDDVRALLRQYASNGAYYKRGSQPLVSTFEGPKAAGDWSSIKSEFGIYFIPDWSSLGAKKALEAAPSGVVDGLFSWAAWPWGNRKIDTYTDASYLNYLGGPDTGKAKYMMPVSPWFYTNMPGYSKNWMWNGVDLWHERWQQVLTVQPEFVEIISWNDFGESHYIGPVRDSPPFKTGQARFDYVTGQTHDGWRVTLPYYIDLYKTGTTSVAKESVVAWYTLHSLPLCSAGDTTLNTATQEQYEYEPPIGRTIYFSAVLASVANVTISVGGTQRETSWSHEPYGGVGVYHGNVQAGDLSGDVRVILKRGNDVLATINGKAIGGCGPDGLANFNPWVGSASSTKSIAAKSPPMNVADMVCVEGTGIGDFQDICKFNCKYTNCPVTACVCTKLGPKPTIPKWQNTPGYTRGDPNFIGLCNYGCNLGYCPSDVCSTTPMPIVEPTVSPFYPDTCVEGTALSAYPKLKDLCEFSCKYGNCPIRRCKCNSMGPLRPFPPEDDSIKGVAAHSFRDDMVVNLMCGFTCPFGGCVHGACVVGTIGVVTSGPGCDQGASKDDWKCITCRDHSDYISPDVRSADTWDLAKVSDSLEEFQDWYDDNYDNFDQARGYYTRAIAVFYNARGGDFVCGTADSAGCTDLPECSSDVGSLTVAGAVVLGSLVEMNLFFREWETELHNAAMNISFWGQKFADTFAKQVDNKSLGDEFGKWLVENVMGALLGSVWKAFSEKTNGAFDDAEGYYGQLTDFITGKITNALEESMQKEQNFTKDDIEQGLSEIITVELEGINRFTVSMFNASKDSGDDRRAFANAIRGGGWLKSKDLTPLGLEKKAVSYLFYQLIPLFWQRKNNLAPVIIKSDVENDNSNPFGRKGSPDDKDYQTQLLSDDQAASVRLNWDKHTFWLVAAKRCDSWSNVPQFGWTCEEPTKDQHWILPPGIEELGPDSAWGVNKSEMVVSAWNGYKLNGNKNGYDLQHDEKGKRYSDDGTNFLFGAGPQTPGLNKIPICDYALARSNMLWWYGLNNRNADKPCPEYPCCQNLNTGNPP